MLHCSYLFSPLICQIRFFTINITYPHPINNSQSMVLPILVGTGQPHRANKFTIQYSGLVKLVEHSKNRKKSFILYTTQDSKYSFQHPATITRTSIYIYLSISPPLRECNPHVVHHYCLRMILFVYNVLVYNVCANSGNTGLMENLHSAFTKAFYLLGTTQGVKKKMQQL
jgi:hypothetical protein